MRQETEHGYALRTATEVTNSAIPSSITAITTSRVDDASEPAGGNTGHPVGVGVTGRISASATM